MEMPLCATSIIAYLSAVPIAATGVKIESLGVSREGEC